MTLVAHAAPAADSTGPPLVRPQTQPEQPDFQPDYAAADATKD